MKIFSPSFVLLKVVILVYIANGGAEDVTVERQLSLNPFDVVMGTLLAEVFAVIISGTRSILTNPFDELERRDGNLEDYIIQLEKLTQDKFISVIGEIEKLKIRDKTIEENVSLLDNKVDSNEIKNRRQIDNLKKTDDVITAHIKSVENNVLENEKKLNDLSSKVEQIQENVMNIGKRFTVSKLLTTFSSRSWIRVIFRPYYPLHCGKYLLMCLMSLLT